MTMRVLVTTSYLRPGGEVDKLLSDAGFDTVFTTPAQREATGTPLADLVRDVDGIVAGTDAFSADVIEAAPRLKVFGRCGAGYDNIDLDAATRGGVAVTYTPGANRRSVAEHVLALMLNCARLIPQNIASVRAGRWEQRSGRELDGAVLGLIGLGSIGKTVARLALPLGMRVVAHDPHPDEEFLTETGVEARTFEEVLAEADFLSLHIFLDDTTRHLIDASALRKVKPGAFLINTARGEVVDEEALADALESGALAGAALDVLTEEPMPLDNRLRGLDNVVVTAHIGAATEQARSRSSMMAAQQVIDVLLGQAPGNLANPGYTAVARR
ncbi:phosphoglycerate dehydrogenase [Amycolatopsis azurea]|uniref:Phosphoglycerate dehydrogenase n=1 Tax=Amycolatopsis azurea DSM 43854 TaxID=1238180 RepID=M2QU01_9PSEU|nr:phosphoglycerate dehydrogenase [Amycolatopsis azurea]EMD29482.1 D-3-phosphoglycerate dehydrogenase [Amycolatopsis azurea DSM 43854]OOC02738.1 phosphoglycerate dehydrogenase [Amycolatopsis azurea DSM 43854]